MNLTKTPYLVLFVLLGGIGIGAASAVGVVTLDSPLNMGTNQINNIAEPTASTDAATKSYVDSNSGIDPATQAQINNIETETNKIQILKNDVVKPFIKKVTGLPAVCAPKSSTDKDTIRIKSGLDREFIVIGVFVKVQANAAGHDVRVTGIKVDGTLMNLVSEDLTGSDQPFSTKTAFEILGAKTVADSNLSSERGSFIPFQLAATDDIRIEIKCVAPGGEFPTDLLIEEIIVSGWQRDQDIMIVSYGESAL